MQQCCICSGLLCLNGASRSTLSAPPAPMHLPLLTQIVLACLLGGILSIAAPRW
jgi:hypothetical protein